jgi:hypothetical protein
MPTHLTRGPLSLKGRWLTWSTVPDAFTSGEVDLLGTGACSGGNLTAEESRQAYFDLHPSPPGSKNPWPQPPEGPGPGRWRLFLMMSRYPATELLLELGYSQEEAAYWEEWRVASRHGSTLPSPPDCVLCSAQEVPEPLGTGVAQCFLLWAEEPYGEVVFEVLGRMSEAGEVILAQRLGPVFVGASVLPDLSPLNRELTGLNVPFSLLALAPVPRLLEPPPFGVMGVMPEQAHQALTELASLHGALVPKQS